MIQTRNLAFAHPGTMTLVFADLDVPQGGTLLLRGASGAGKSTWLSLAAGLRSPSSGQITVAGQTLGDLTGAARDTWRAQAVGFLPQKLHLSDALTVHGNLALVYFAAGLAQDDAAIAQALAALGVGDLAGRKPHQLSGGQAQRLALARAVLLAPQVILADEPTASLDDEAAQAALNLLQTSAQRCGATLVIATHDRRVEQALPGAQVHFLGMKSASDAQ